MPRRPQSEQAHPERRRLTEQTLALLRGIGLDFDAYGQRLYSAVRNFGLDLLFTRDDGIPQYVASGTADLGVVGQNLIEEEGAEVIIAAKNRSGEELTNEMADLWFHSLLVLQDAGLAPVDVFRSLAARYRSARDLRRR